MGNRAKENFRKNDGKENSFMHDGSREINVITDLSGDIRSVLSMTPKEGFNKKIELITSAEDMSTTEKIQAINDAENKFSQDLEKSFTAYNKAMWTKVCAGAILFIGGVTIATSPESKRFLCSLFKSMDMNETAIKPQLSVGRVA